ncbi:MAG: sigma-70 family RNA polymerase sigma factor [Bdellovibrionales bacterium]|nr:sigma-70 family RNA polymerase sigma factor [Bdellovibrionales bacterium]
MIDDLERTVQQAQANNFAAWSLLVQTYQIPAKRVAYTILGSQEDVEDALQDAWLLATQKLGTLYDPTRFGGWFYRIVANVALRKRQQRAANPATLALLESVIAPETGVPNHRLVHLPFALQALSDKDRIVVSLHYFCDARLATIADLLDIPIGTVKSRLSHARDTLRKELQQMNEQTSTRPEHIPADFRQTIDDTQGELPWQLIFRGDFVGWFANRQPIPTGTIPDQWGVLGTDGLVGADQEAGTSLIYGDPQWRDLEFSLLVTALAGGNIQVLFRFNEQMNSWYQVDMMIGWQAIAVSRLTFNGQGNAEVVKLSVVNYPLAHQREYSLSLATRGHSITTYIDGAIVNQLTDATWLGGQVGLNVWHGKTLFRDLRIRLLP